MHKLSVGYSTLIKKALSVMSLDNGFVIAVQTMTFLICYLSLGGRILSQVEQLESLDLFTILAMLLLHIINVAIIIVRISGLNRGLKYPFWVCYQQAIRRLPSLLCFILGFCLVLGFIKLPPLISFMVTIFGLPFFIFASSHIVDQQLNWIKATIETVNFIRQKLDYKLCIYLSLSYGITLSLCVIGFQTKFANYLTLIMELLLLFCHIMTITVYTQSCPPKTNQTNPKVKVIVA